jgi:hypothetical protein
MDTAIKKNKASPHDIDIDREIGMTIRVDGIVKAKTAGLQKIFMKIPATIPGR